MKFLSNIRNKIFGFAKNEEGASAIEYAVLAGIIIVALAAFGGGLQSAFTTSSTNIKTAIEDGPAAVGTP
jgi:pilus assembly protein Flp/PilA